MEAPPRRRGGLHQRRAAAAAAAPPPAQSSLVQYLLTQWAWGHMTTPQLQEIGRRAREDLEANSAEVLAQVSRLASLGAEGAYVGNLHRDLQRALQQPRLCQPLLVQLPLKEDSVQGWRMEQQHMLLPHEIFSSLFHEYPDAFRAYMAPSSEAISEWWAAVDGSQQFREHPCRERPTLRTRGVPLSLHGDGVPIVGVGTSASKSMDVISFTSLLATAATKQITYMVWCCYAHLYSQAWGRRTLDAAMRIIAWSLEALQMGRWPATQWDGSAHPPGSLAARRAGEWLADGFFGIIWVLRGDLDWAYKVWKFPHYGSERPCGWCPCSIRDNALPWTDLRPDADWVSQVHTTAAFEARFPGRSRLLHSPGISVQACWMDYMHVKHLGVDQYFLGSVLWLMCFARPGGRWPVAMLPALPLPLPPFPSPSPPAPF